MLPLTSRVQQRPVVVDRPAVLGIPTMRSPYTAVIRRGDDGCQNTSASAAPLARVSAWQHRRIGDAVVQRRAVQPGLARIHLVALPPLPWPLPSDPSLAR